MPTNEKILKGTINTAAVTSGLLNKEQAKKFIQQTFEATPLGQAIRHEMRTARTGEIDKIGISSRIVRKKTEGVDDGYRAGADFSKIEYSTTAVRLPWEITGETLRENIEQAQFEKIITNLMTTQFGIDLMDLYLNSDESISAQYDTGKKDGSDQPIMADTPDYDFLKINTGWIKQISDGGHVIDATAKSGMSLDLFYNAVKALPNKYNNGKLRWLMSPHRAQEWELYLMNQVIKNGGAVPENTYTSPVKIPTIEVPQLSDDVILLTDPQNLVVVNTYDVQIRKTAEGKEAIMTDKVFYNSFLDFDPVIEELDASAIIKGLN